MIRLLRPALFASLSLFGTVCLLAAMPSAGAADWPDREIVPSGVIRTEIRQPGVFSRIALSGPINVEVRQGSHPGVTVKADDNVLPLLETTLEGSGPDATLRVRFRGNFQMRSKPHVDLVIETEHLDAVALGGVGNFVARGLKTPRLQVSMGGVGNIELPALETDDLKVSIGGNGTIRVDGRTHGLTLSIAGHGSSDTLDLAADDVKVTIAGQGDAKVRADRSLGVTIAGSGEVVYRGDVDPRTTIVGHGKVTKG